MVPGEEAKDVSRSSQRRLDKARCGSGVGEEHRSIRLQSQATGRGNAENSLHASKEWVCRS